MDALDFLTSKEVREFIRENLNADVQKLILNPPGEFNAHIKLIANQLLARQKAVGKLDNWVNDFNLIFPPPLSVEQASSERTATYKQSFFMGKQLVDLTGGMGVDCLVLSEHFEQTTYVEKEPQLAGVFQHNCIALRKTISIANTDAISFLRESGLFTDTHFFIDPARRDDHKQKVFKLADCTPNVLEILPLVQDPSNQLLIKLSPLLDLKATLAEIGNVKEVHIVAIKNEVKELLLLVDFNYQGEPLIKTINLDSTTQQYDFQISDEEHEESELGNLKKYLFEPNAAILKAGAFKKIGTDFRLAKIHPNTHLFTSDQIIEDWPGRMFEVIETDTKRNLDRYLTNGQINVMTRNYPLSPTELKKKMKVKDGGDYFLIGFRDQHSKPQLVVAKKVF